MPTLPPVPNTPLRDDPTQDSIWKRWLQLLKANYAGLGTVTSVAQTVPSEFSVAGSPVTTSGTLAISKATQTANTVWAGPTTGADATPAFRALVAGDLPSGVGSLLIIYNNENLEIATNTQVTGHANLTFSGTGNLTIDGTGSLAIL